MKPLATKYPIYPTNTPHKLSVSISLHRILLKERDAQLIFHVNNRDETIETRIKTPMKIPLEGSKNSKAICEKKSLKIKYWTDHKKSN